MPHFRTSVVREIGGWDAYNVTEDADLGFRLARFGYRSVTLDSKTMEEAPTSFAAWLPQRSRWMKGWLHLLSTFNFGNNHKALRLKRSSGSFASQHHRNRPTQSMKLRSASPFARPYRKIVKCDQGERLREREYAASWRERPSQPSLVEAGQADQRSSCRHAICPPLVPVRSSDFVCLGEISANGLDGAGSA